MIVWSVLFCLDGCVPPTICRRGLLAARDSPDVKGDEDDEAKGAEAESPLNDDVEGVEEVWGGSGAFVAYPGDGFDDHGNGAEERNGEDGAAEKPRETEISLRLRVRSQGSQMGLDSLVSSVSQGIG